MAPLLMHNDIARLREKLAAERGGSKRPTLDNPVAESERTLRAAAFTFGRSGNYETRQMKRPAVLYAGKYF